MQVKTKEKPACSPSGVWRWRARAYLFEVSVERRFVGAKAGMSMSLEGTAMARADAGPSLAPMVMTSRLGVSDGAVMVVARTFLEPRSGRPSCAISVNGRRVPVWVRVH